MKRALRLASWLAAVMAAALAPACARPKPVVLSPPPALAVPVVPERVVAAVPEEPPAEPEPVEPEPKPAARPARPRPRPPSAPADQSQKTEPQPEQAGPPDPPKVADAPAGGVLRTPQTVDEPEAARRVREALSRASGQLSRVNVGALSRDARSQYDTARRFIDQAEGALVAHNYMFAAYLADKAETLARGLAGR